MAERVLTLRELNLLPAIERLAVLPEDDPSAG